VARAAVDAQGQTLGFSFSAGLTLVRDGEAAELALERADQALYRAKAEGRDRYVLG
jgi:PleD family two-component response regulator